MIAKTRFSTIGPKYPNISRLECRSGQRRLDSLPDQSGNVDTGGDSLVSIALEEEIASLPALSKAELLTRWRERLKQPPPSHLNKPILVPLLAYRLQEQAFGGLKPTYKRRLRELAESFERNPGRAAKTVSSSTRIKPGTRLIREWDSQTHQVTVAEEGFEYKGERYKSLSEIARLITGPRFPRRSLQAPGKPDLHRRGLSQGKRLSGRAQGHHRPCALRPFVDPTHCSVARTLRC
jgi:hypothetical protein